MARSLAYGIGAALLLAGCAYSPGPEPYGAYYGAYGPAYPDYYYYGAPSIYGFGCCAGEFRRREHEHDRDHDHDRGRFRAGAPAVMHAAPPASGGSVPPRPIAHGGGPAHSGGGAPAATHHAPAHTPAGHEHEGHS